MLMRVDFYNFIEFCVTKTPLHTPNRNEFVRNKLRKYATEHASVIINIIDVVQIKNYKHFQCTDDCIYELVRVLPRFCTKPDDLSVVLIPTKTYCCDKTYRIDPRYSSVTLYDVDGIK